MKTKLLLMLVAVGLMAGVAQANLLLNPGFEEGAFTGSNLTPDFWVHYYISYSPVHIWVSDADEAHSGEKFMKMYNWLVTVPTWSSAAWLGQDVLGVKEDGDYTFTVWAKNGAEDQINLAGIYCEWWDSLNNWIDSDSVVIPVTDSDWIEVDFGTFTAPEGAVAATFWLVAPASNGLNAICYDDAYMGIPRAFNPSPADGSTILLGNVNLSWTNMDPHTPGDSVYVDVWFGTDPESLTQIVDAGENVSSVTVGALDSGIYYWQVNSYIYGDPIEGHVWSFDVVADTPPYRWHRPH